MNFAQDTYMTFHKNTSRIMMITIVATIVAIRMCVVPGRRKRVIEKAVSPAEILIPLTHDHPLDSISLSKALPYRADSTILALGNWH